ncbi:hypothetical protein AAFF_G00154340 [Aldrovandia affinis]|uniref:Uncharacterized protein n=1 Tax=Aldrovandia affinis TaxID=143900 RepID=A0AAD7SZU2_9TELE|nr:hypothetical protein AAFF_G00154340 [Aldrovandia affinis]
MSPAVQARLSSTPSDPPSTTPHRSAQPGQPLEVKPAFLTSSWVPNPRIVPGSEGGRGLGEGVVWFACFLKQQALGRECLLTGDEESFFVPLLNDHDKQWA